MAASSVKNKAFLRIAVSALLTLALLYAVFSEIHLAQFKQLLLGIDRTLLASYLLLSIFSYFCRAYRYQLLLSAMSEVQASLSFSRLFLVTTIRNALVDLLPLRLGEVSYLYVLSRLGVPLSAGASSFALCFVLDAGVLLGIFACLIFAAPLILQTQEVQRWGELGLLQDSYAYLGLLLFVAVCIFLFQAHRILSWLLSSNALLRKLPPRLLDFMEHVASDLAQVVRKGRYPLLLLTTALLRVAKYLSLYLLLYALLMQFGVTRSDLNPLLVLSAFISAEAAASLPVSGLMGFGAYELVWAGIFNLPEAVSVNKQAIGLGVHLITQIVGYSFGLVGVGWFLMYELRNKSLIRNKKPGN